MIMTIESTQEIRQSMIDDFTEMIDLGIKEKKIFIGDIIDIVEVGAEFFEYNTEYDIEKN